MKFKTPVAMRCNEEQFNEIKPKLEAMGFQFHLVASFLKVPYLIFKPELGFITNEMDVRKAMHGRVVLEQWNEKLFLALAAMTDDDVPHLHEYFICIKDTSVIRPAYEEGQMLRMKPFNTVLTLGIGYLRNYFRKATVDEILKHFRVNQPVKESELRFQQSVAYPCTEAEYKELSKALMEKGYYERGSFQGQHWIVTNVTEGSFKNHDWNHLYIVALSKEHFLALASMSDDEIGIKGECVFRKDTASLYFIEGPSADGKYINRRKSDNRAFGWTAKVSWSKYFRKATPQEITAHFNKAETQAPLQFLTSVVMPVTHAQYLDIMPEMIKLGYTEIGEYFRLNDTIKTWPASREFAAVTAWKSNPKEITTVGMRDYNKAEFLALAAMSNAPEGIVGEWFINKHKNLAIKTAIKPTPNTTAFKYVDRSGYSSRPDSEISDFWAKASVEDIRKHFKSKRLQDEGTKMHEDFYASISARRDIPIVEQMAYDREAILNSFMMPKNFFGRFTQADIYLKAAGLLKTPEQKCQDDIDKAKKQIAKAQKALDYLKARKGYADGLENKAKEYAEHYKHEIEKYNIETAAKVKEILGE